MPAAFCGMSDHQKWVETGENDAKSWNGTLSEEITESTDRRLHRRRGSSETLGTRPGIHVIPPTGQLVAFAETPEDTITNCTFGGPDLRTLYITCGKLLLSLRTRIPGKGKVGGT